MAVAASTRTLAWATGNADFGTQFIVSEAAMAAVLFTGAWMRSEEAAEGGR